MPASKDSESLAARHTRATSGKQTKRMREEGDTGTLERKRPRKSEEVDMDVIRDHMAAFLNDIRATKKKDDWYEAHQKLYGLLKNCRAKMPKETSIDNKIATPSQSTKHSEPGAPKTKRTSPQECLQVVLRRLEAALERHYNHHLEESRASTTKTASYAMSSGARSSFSTYYRPMIKSVERMSVASKPRPEPKPEPKTEPKTENKPEPEPEPSLKFNNTGRYNLRQRVVPEEPKQNDTGGMRHRPKPGELDDGEEDHENDADEAEAYVDVI
ncbi:hypothetical protein QBC32DRAFT_326692 [Pseudoneurospora amorphoporcata]|uniref:Uncharacterized protein n=1 Tax=Pseudoneurospora amorphoporcata TaxID=241081 RepID=A0AAN6NPS0_9PEZI|nr:hypothetical protein QBC32DRAFT_326692 [Pseudoneurospora amorphoporcata]